MGRRSGSGCTHATCRARGSSNSRVLSRDTELGASCHWKVRRRKQLLTPNPPTCSAATSAGQSSGTRSGVSWPRRGRRPAGAGGREAQAAGFQRGNGWAMQVCPNSACGKPWDAHMGRTGHPCMLPLTRAQLPQNDACRGGVEGGHHHISHINSCSLLRQTGRALPSCAGPPPSTVGKHRCSGTCEGCTRQQPSTAQRVAFKRRLTEAPHIALLVGAMAHEHLHAGMGLELRMTYRVSSGNHAAAAAAERGGL